MGVGKRERGEDAQVGNTASPSSRLVMGLLLLLMAQPLPYTRHTHSLTHSSRSYAGSSCAEVEAMAARRGGASARGGGMRMRRRGVYFEEGAADERWDLCKPTSLMCLNGCDSLCVCRGEVPEHPSPRDIIRRSWTPVPTQQQLCLPLQLPLVINSSSFRLLIQ